MKHVYIFLNVLMISIFLLNGCGTKDTGETTSQVISESASELVELESTEDVTGYPNGEAQRIYVMYNEQLYVYDDNGRTKIDETDISDKYELYSIKKATIDDGTSIPTENLHSVRAGDNSTIYINPNDSSNILLYSSGEIMKLIPSK